MTASHITPRSDTSPLVGRSGELRRLSAAVDRAARGRGGTVLLVGDAGIGKSRLAAEALDVAARRGFTILQGAAYPLHGDLAYAPFLDAFGPYLDQHPSGDLVRDLPDLGRLFGGLRLPPVPPLGDPALERTRLLDAVARLVRVMAARQPLALLVDDLHWADPASLDLFHYLARGLAGQPVLLVGSYRPDEVGERLRALVRALRRVGAVDQVDLPGLSGDDVAALVRGLLGGPPPAPLLDGLTRRAAGSPLFVYALVDGLLATGALRRRGPGWVVDRDALATVPPVIRDLVLTRLERLDPADRSLLEWVVVAADAATARVLDKVAEGDLVDGLRRLTGAGLIGEVRRGPELAYRPSHPLISEVAYDELPETVRRARHAALAGALDGADVERLAHHYRGAGPAVDPARALDVLVAAAERALDVHADEEAAAHLAAALDAARVARPAAVIDLLERLGRAQARAGRPADAVASWRAALAEAPEPAAVARLHAQLAAAIWDQGRFDEARAELAAGTRAAHTLELQLLRTRLLGRSGDAEGLDREADLLREHGGDDPQALAALYLARGEAAMIRGDLPASCAHSLRGVSAATVADQPLMVALGHRQAFVAELSLGNLAAAREHNRADFEAARRSGVPMVDTSPRMCLMLTALAVDAWDDGLRTSDSLIALGNRFGAMRAVAAGLSFQGVVLAQRGRPDEAAALIAEAREVYGRGSGADRHIHALTEMAEATVALARGDAALARTLSASASAIPGLLPALTMAVRGQAELALGDPAAALATAGRMAAVGPGPWPSACAAWLEGLARHAAGEPAALDLLARGAAGLAALDMPFQAARARLDWAAAAADSAVAADCLAVFERYDARPLADRARSLLRDLGVRPAPAARRPGRELSERELEVVRLVAGGLSNAEVAARLYISPRTVTTHLQHVYARLGLPSRTALVRWVHDQNT